MRVAYAVERINEIGSQSLAKGKASPNPLALLIAAMGAQERDASHPWEVPIFFQRRWETLQSRREQLLDAQARINRLRQQGPAAGGGAASGGSTV
ncbi:MAG: hypothetical protein ACK4WH_00830 [Phycisphaerales bacterium]